MKYTQEVNDKIRKTEPIQNIRVAILNFIGPKENSVFDIHNTNGIKLLSRLRLNFSHLDEHTFRHNFNDTVDSMSTCGQKRRQHLNASCAIISIQPRD